MRQVERARGIVHVHTALSADGVLDVADIAAMCRERGLAFVAITDHAEDMTEHSLAALARDCEEHSRDGLVLIPGLEYRFRGGVHILALGEQRLDSRETTVESLDELVRQGCLLVAAHCAASEELPARLLEILSAVEIWNVSRHTRFLPAKGCAAAYRRWAQAYPDLFAIGGLDMHRGNEWGCEVVLDNPCELKAQAVLAAIRAGAFSTRGKLVSFGSRPSRGVRDLAFVAGDLLAGVRDARNRALYRCQYVKE